MAKRSLQPGVVTRYGTPPIRARCEGHSLLAEFSGSDVSLYQRVRNASAMSVPFMGCEQVRMEHGPGYAEVQA